VGKRAQQVRLPMHLIAEARRPERRRKKSTKERIELTTGVILIQSSHLILELWYEEELSYWTKESSEIQVSRMVRSLKTQNKTAEASAIPLKPLATLMDNSEKLSKTMTK